MNKKWFAIGEIVCLVLLLVGCNGTNEFTVVDEREVLGEVFVEQTGGVDNSQSDTRLVQDVAVRREFRHRINLELLSNANLDRGQVEDRILATYDLSDGVGEKICIVPADIPPRTRYQYDLEWTQVLRQGDIEEGNIRDGNLLGTYTIVTDLQCQTLGFTQP